MPSFGGPHWYIVDAATGKLIKDLQTPATDGAHNTIVSLDGTKAFLAGLGSKTMSIADTRTNTVAQTVGPFSGNVRPFTVNGAGTLIYANVNDLLGYQVGDVKTGKVIQTIQVQGFGLEASDRGRRPPAVEQPVRCVRIASPFSLSSRDSSREWTPGPRAARRLRAFS